LVLAAVLYLGLLWIFPEPRAVFPAAGPRWIPSRDVAVPPVTDSAGHVVAPGHQDLDLDELAVRP
jgi:hypothetical protein